jgi:hypothetical protein
MIDPFLDQRGLFAYDKVLDRLIEINEKLLESCSKEPSVEEDSTGLK